MEKVAVFYCLQTVTHPSSNYLIASWPGGLFLYRRWLPCMANWSYSDAKM